MREIFLCPVTHRPPAGTPGPTAADRRDAAWRSPQSFSASSFFGPLGPVLIGYSVWTLMGYPLPTRLKTFFEKNFTRLSESFRPRPHFSSTGNFAFEEYRRRELERLEAERRRLDDEARAFAEFVEELKRAKDREEFDAFMARRRAAPAAG